MSDETTPPLSDPIATTDATEDATEDSGTAVAVETVPAGTRFPVQVPGFTGSLEQLVVRAQRGEVDLTQIKVAEITGTYRKAATEHDLRDTADFLALVSRLINLKAEAVLPDPAAAGDDDEEEAPPETDAGRRLAEYRLFRAAAEALLAEAAEDGARSFLGMVAPDVVPIERLRIPPERLAGAFRAVLERLSADEPLPIGTVTFSVDEMVERLRTRLAETRSIAFEAIFTGVASRLEAVALFLGLLELLRRGEAEVDQEDAFGPIRVTACG